MPRKGYIRVFTGEGKGKTAAALGLALRAVGAGGAIYIARFLRPWDDGEWKGFARLDGEVMYRQFGREGLAHENPREDDLQAAREALDEIRRALRSERYALVVLDEVTLANCVGLLTVEDLLALIEEKPRQVDLIITGCCADPRLMQRADIVIVMQEVKGNNNGF